MNTAITTIPNPSGSLQSANGTAAGGANLTTAWDTAAGSNTVNVAIVDTGILSHADLTGIKINTGSGFIINTLRNNSGDNIGTDPGNVIATTDITSNPTVCSGVTSPNSSWRNTSATGPAAAQHSETRAAGIAPGVSVRMARALGHCGDTRSDIIGAATQTSGGVVARTSPSINPAPTKVISMSPGSTGSCDISIQTTIINAHNRGAVIVVAIGNESASAVDSPANCTRTIAAAAYTLGGDKMTYANVGTGTTLSTPGGSNGSVVNGLGALIVSPSNTGTTSADSPGYLDEAGTPMATPHMTGVAALMPLVNGTLMPDRTATVPEQSVRPFPAGTYCAAYTGACGAGMLGTGTTVALARGNPTVYASTSASMVVTNNTVALTAIGSTDPVNTITNVQWAQTSGPPIGLTTVGLGSNGSYTTTFMPSVTSTYASNVTLTSNTGVTAADTTNVTVTATASTGTTTPFTAISSSGGGGGAIGLAGAALLLAVGLAGRRRYAK